VSLLAYYLSYLQPYFPMQSQERKYQAPVGYSYSVQPGEGADNNFADGRDVYGSSDQNDADVSEVLVSDVWSRRVVIGIACTLAAISLIAVLRHVMSPKCYTVTQDGSIGCALGGYCKPDVVTACYDPERLVRMGAEMMENGFKRGRTNVFPFLFKLLLVCVLNLRGTAWISQRFYRRVVPADSWAVILWTLVAIAPDLLDSAVTPLYTNMIESSSMTQQMSHVVTHLTSKVNVFGWVWELVVMVWAWAFTALHLYASVRGQRAVSRGVRKASRLALDSTSRALSNARNVITPFLLPAAMETADVQTLEQQPQQPSQSQSYDIPQGFVPMRGPAPSAPPMVHSILKRKATTSSRSVQFTTPTVIAADAEDSCGQFGSYQPRPSATVPHRGPAWMESPTLIQTPSLPESFTPAYY